MNQNKEFYQMQTLPNVNEVREARENKMMSKAELARKAGVTVQTIDRIEKGYECRLATKRKIILALGYELADRTKIFKGPDHSEGEDKLETSETNLPEGDYLTPPKQSEKMRILRKTDTKL